MSLNLQRMVDKDSDGRIYKEESEEIKYKIILFKFVQHTRWRRKVEKKGEDGGAGRWVQARRGEKEKNQGF